MLWQQQTPTEVCSRAGLVLAQPGTSEPETRLRAGWERDGGDPADVDRLRAMVKYREVWHRFWTVYTHGGKRVRRATEQIEAFGITTGHDVNQLAWTPSSRTSSPADGPGR